jgi:hypothetical protein
MFLQQEDLSMLAIETMYVISAKSGENLRWLLCEAEHGPAVLIPGADK